MHQNLYGIFLQNNKMKLVPLYFLTDYLNFNNQAMIISDIITLKISVTKSSLDCIY